MAYPPPPQYAPPPPPPTSAYANWGQRVGAMLIDYAPVLVISLVNSLIHNSVLSLLLSLIAIAIWGFNRWYQAGPTGQSWGKKALNIKLVSEETGQPIGIAMSFARDLAHLIDWVICFVGYLFPLWDAKRQTLADKIIKTVVIPV